MVKNELVQQIENEIWGAKAKISLLIEDLDTNEILVAHEAEKTVVSASIIKVPIMLTALELIQEGRYSPDTVIEIPEVVILQDTQVFKYGAGRVTLEELLVWMIINSDNSATNCLIDLLTMDRINDFCHRLLLKSTKLERKMLDFNAMEAGWNNYTSAKDMEIIFKALYHKSILTPEICDYAIGILRRQRHKQLALRYIADDVIVAHKTGDLDFLKHDVGTFYLDKANYYFGAFVTDALNDVYAEKWIGRISKLVYEYYKGI
jgi:beta-lactamase class A